MLKSSEFHKKIGKIFKVVIFNLTLLSVGMVFFLGVLFVLEHMNHDKELAINNTIFNEHDISPADKKSIKEPYKDWYLSSSEKIAALDKKGLSNRYLIQVLNKFRTDDPLLHVKPISNYKTKVRSFYQGKVIYDVTYKFDEYSRRYTPLNEPFFKREDNSKFVAVFGGSFAFGDGVKESETLAYYLGKFNDLKAFNYGFQGYGPQHMYLQINKEKISEQIPSGEGVVVYYYLPHHRNRLIGTMKELRWSQGFFPYLEFSEVGEPTLKGNFSQARPVYFKALNFLASLEPIARSIGDFPSPYSEDALEKMCNLLLATKKQLREKLPRGHFLVLIDPNTPFEDDLVEACLDIKKISYYDARKRRSDLPKKYSILKGVEDHHTAATYRAIARWMSQSGVMTLNYKHHNHGDSHD